MDVDMFGPYQLLALLGRGGMGEVWRAVDTRKGRQVALKVLGRWMNADPAYSARFRREASLAARLSAPHVLAIHDYGEIDGKLFIDMPLIDGFDLEALVARDGPLLPARAVDLVEQIAEALDAAHAADLLHRDVKPSNVLITTRQGDSDFAYLIDFGIARAGDGTQITTAGRELGTLAYMSPERFNGDGDRRVDVYALACVLYMVLAGRPPFVPPPGAHELGFYVNAHLHLPPPRAAAQSPAVPAALDEVIAHGMAKQPTDRYSSAGELARAARAAIAETPQTVPAPPPPLVDLPRPHQFPTTQPLSPPHLATSDSPSPARAPFLATHAPAPRRRVLVISVVAALTVAVTVALTIFWTSRSPSTTPPPPSVTVSSSPPTPAGSVAKDDVAGVLADQLQKQHIDAQNVTCPRDLPAGVGQSVRCSFTVAGQPVDAIATVTSVGGSVHYDITTEARPITKELLAQKVAEQVRQQANLPVESATCDTDLQPTVKASASCTIISTGQPIALTVVVTDVAGGLIRYSIKRA